MPVSEDKSLATEGIETGCELSGSDRAKLAAARRALDEVVDGMRLGLGTGSTANWFVRLLGERVRREHLRLLAVPTSHAIARLARDEGIPLAELCDIDGKLDLTVDGADEFDADLNLLKGGGGALLREKIVASASKRMFVIADETKAVNRLGSFPLPVEVARFSWQATTARIGEALKDMHYENCCGKLRLADGKPFETDGGNHILDLTLGQIGDPRDLSRALCEVPGVFEHGLFCGLCDRVAVGSEDGSARILA